MRQDAQQALRGELDRLVDAAEKSDQEYFSNEFNSFANLFERFLQARGPSIDWELIKPPAEGMVIFDYGDIAKRTYRGFRLYWNLTFGSLSL